MNRLLSCRQAFRRAPVDGHSEKAAHRAGLFQARKDRRPAVNPSKHSPPGRQPGEAADRAGRLLPDNSSQTDEERYGGETGGAQRGEMGGRGVND